MLAGDIVETVGRRRRARRSRRSSCSTACARSSTSTGSARGTCGRDGSVRAAARTSRSCSSATTGAFVLRRPPRPPLPPSAHDVVREARLQLALREAGLRAAADDRRRLRGREPARRPVLRHGRTSTGSSRRTSCRPGSRASRRGVRSATTSSTRSSRSTRPTSTTPGLAAFARPGSYNERQVRRFAQLWEINKTRELPRVDEVGGVARRATCPIRSPPTVVHGDFRLGNTMVGRDDPSRILAVLDWEMGAIGDPRADVGYLLATYSEPGGPPNPLGTSPVTALPGFPSRAELVERYVAAKRTRRRAARVVRGARALEGGGLLRGDLRPLRARRAGRRGRARRALRAGRALSRGGGCRGHCLVGTRSSSSYSAISASALSASGCCVETSSDVAPDSRHASSRSARRSFGPTSATSSMNASGTAAAASRLCPSR